MTKYTVVENAGYEDEQDIRSFKTLGAAIAHVERHYDADERDHHNPNSLHIGIRADRSETEREYVA